MMSIFMLLIEFKVVRVVFDLRESKMAFPPSLVNLLSFRNNSVRVSSVRRTSARILAPSSPNLKPTKRGIKDGLLCMSLFLF